MKNSYLVNVGKLLTVLLTIMLSTQLSRAQLSGPKSIPADYASIAAFVTDVNTQGVGPGGVTLNVPAGYTETAPVAGIQLTATGTAANPIIIQKSGAGTNPVLNAGVGVGTPGTAVQDGVFALIGSDFVTIDGLDIADANTTNPATMEYGYGLFKASATDGCQNNIIRNCTITLSTVNNAAGTAPAFDGSRGINVVNSLVTTQTTVVTVTAATGSNSNNQFYTNTIRNTNIGIALSGFAATTPFTLADTGNDVGGASLATGNTITNFGGAASATNPAAGIRTVNQWTLNVAYNTLNNNDGTGSNHVSTLRGIFIGNATSANGTIANNTITVVSGGTTTLLEGISSSMGSTAASNTVSINNNLLQIAYSTATTAVINGILNSGTPATLNINGNTVTNVAALPIAQNVLGGTGTLVMIEGGSPTNLNVLNNNVNTLGRTGLSGNWRIIKITSPATSVISGNTVENLAWSTPISTGGIDGIYSLSSAVNVTISNNTVRNLATPTTGTINGIREFGIAGIKNITGNTVYGFATTSGGAGGATFNGIFSSTGTVTIDNNTIYSLVSSGSSGGTGGQINGIQISSTSAPWTISRNRIYTLSTTSTSGTNGLVNGILATTGNGSITNNIISGLNASAASNTDAVRGISHTGSTASVTTAVNYNTVYLNASSAGANFGATGIFHTGSTTATTSALNMQNNIIINESTPAGTGLIVAFRRATAASTNLVAASNRNLLYSGTPGAARLIYTDGTTPQQTLAGYQAVLAPGHDANSITGEAPFTGPGYGTAGNFFISLTGASVDFLRPVAGITTQAESGAANIPGITADYSSVIRAGNAGYSGTGTNPDIGAYEFAGVSPAPSITLNSVTPPTSTQCVAAARLVSVDITTVSGTITGANLVYSINGVPQTPISMTNGSGSTWTATIPVPSPVNATIAWGVTATNSLGLNSSYVGTTYADEPLFGFTASASASSSTVCSANPTNLTALLNNPAASTLYSTPSITNPVTDEDIRTVRITQGATTLLDNTSTINTLNGTIGVPTGTAGSYSNYTAFAPTTLTGGQSYTLFVASIDAPGYFTNYATAFIDFNRDGDFADAGESIIPSTGVMLNAAVDNGNDSISVSFTVPASALNGLTRLRVANTETGQTNATGTLNNGFGEFEDYSIMITGGTAGTTANITSVTWMDGATTVGTGNPLTVNPTSTTTYSANITALGCVFSPSPTVMVTVNPLPSAPTATNSAQCGTQVPTASVTSTSALPTPTFVWYSAPTAGTVMQSSTSTTYTSNVATTTTFYVAELNSVTGCESARTPVTVTVATADGILASIDNATICIGSSVVLTASNTNPTPNQTYTYTWTGTAGSGLASQGGTPITVTPTVPGTYTYNLSGVDGGCSAVSSVNVTVNPFTSTVIPINITCNGYNNGSFSQGAVSCGTAASYSVDGGAFGPIPTNLTPGSHTVVTMNTAGFTSASQNITITQPSTTIATPIGTNGTVCQNGTPANVAATSNTNTTSPQSVVVSFTVAAQPAEVSSSTVPASVAASPNLVATAVMSALPAGAVVTGGTLNYNNIQATGNSWMSDVRLGLTGPVTQNWTAGTGSANNAGTFNYVSTIPAGSINAAGGTISLHYFDFFNDNGGSEATFPTGAGVASITINYTMPVPATISWWDNASGGTQIGTGSPFNAIGTSVLPNTATPGTYTLYAQGEFGGCSGLTRTPVTVTVNPTSTNTITATACGSYTLNASTYTTSGTYTQTLSNSFGCDSIITLNLTINNPTSSSVTVAACSSYTWAENGTTYTASGSYPVVLAGANANGCDSTITLNLTINQPTSSTVTVSACSSYTWAENGTTYTTSGSYPVVLAGANANGCDSTVTLNLTINQPTSSTVTVSACSSYTWAENGTTYTTSGSYPVVLVGANANGCDSTVTLDLTINQPTSSTVTVSACSSYTWAENGTTYTTSGSYSVVLAGANANGCDSTVTLDLTINQPTSSTVTATACGSYTWSENGTTYTTSGSYPVVLSGANSVGCDSTVTLILTINQPTSSTVTASACESYTWAENGATYTASGSYSVVIAGGNANGCDSTITLNLTINAAPTATATDNGDATITASAGTSYQWIDCGTGNPIAGATAQTLAPSVNGSYAVVVTNASGCSDTSACVLIDYIGISENSDANIAVFPNPTHNDVTITMSASSAKVTVVDAQGKLLQVVEVANGGKVDLSTYETGVYFLRIQTVNGSTLERIVKN